MPFESRVRGNESFKLSTSANRLLVFLLIAFFVLAVGCSGSKTIDQKTIDQKTAEERVSDNLKMDAAHLNVDVGRVGTACVLTLPNGEEIPMDLSPAKSVTSAAGQAAGLISVTADGKGFWKVALTDKGKAAMNGDLGPSSSKKGCDYQSADFILGTPELVKVTGVTADQQAPDAEYLWRWKLTELGRDLRVDGKTYAALTSKQRDELHALISTRTVDFPIPAPQEINVQSGKVSFKKYTDGWRIQ